MKKIGYTHIVGGMAAMAFGMLIAIAVGACGTAADDCRNTRTCPPDYCLEAGDAWEEVDGCQPRMVE